MAATENITVLFTDLVGSTELASTLTSEAADEVRRKHFASLRQAIAASGGTEVKNLGDGLMVVFPAASAALGCAVAMQQAVHRDNAGADRPLGLRVGLSSGEATREADDYFGDPVIEAARLCARADAAQILASDLVRANAGRRSTHTFSSLGELELKGLPAPIETLEVEWRPLSATELMPGRVPLPSRLGITPNTGVVGRETEADLLHEAFKRVSMDAGREVVLISGEPGMGKSTLSAQLARSAFDAGACVLLGRGYEDVGAPYGPFVEALRHLVTYGPEDLLWSHVQTQGPELARIVPALRDRLVELPAPESTDPDTERYLLYGAVTAFFAMASAAQPVLLVLDDLQWADKPSLQLLRHLVTSDTAIRLLVVGVYRNIELSATHPFTETLVALRREPGVSHIELKGLDDIGVVAFLEAAAGHDLPDEGVALAHALYRETDGNPFFVGEVLRHLIETGAVVQDGSGRWSAAEDLSEMALPESVRQVIGSRVARLGERAQQALAFASVIGRDFDLGLLSRATGFSEDELLDILDGAAAAALVQEVPDRPGHYTFSHALIQHTLDQDLGATRRARAHRKVAEALEELCGDDPGERVGELAYHWASATEPVDVHKAIAYARLAAEAALSSLAPEEAVRHYQQALQLLSQQRDPDRLAGVELLLGLGIAQRQAGSAEFRRTLLDVSQRAHELHSVDHLVATALANTRGWFSSVGAVDAERVKVLETALDELPDADGPERALLLATLCSELSFDIRQPLRRTLADDATAMARRMGDPATLLNVLMLVDIPLQTPAALGERLANASEAVRLADALGDPTQRFFASAFCEISAVQAADHELAERCMATMRATSERLRQPTLLWNMAFREAGEALVAGDPERAQEFATAALQIGNDSGQPDVMSIFGAQLVVAYYQLGRLGELISLIESTAAENRGLPVFSAFLALAHLDNGDEEKAGGLLGSAVSEGGIALPLDLVWGVTTALYADVAIELRAEKPSEIFLDALAPHHAQVPYVAAFGLDPIAFYLGGLSSVLGRFDLADQYFDEAMGIVARGTLRFADARTRLARARMLSWRRGPGDVEEARHLLEEARASAQSCGYARVERQATEELSKLA